MNVVNLFFAGDFCSTPSAKPIVVSEDLRTLISSCDFKICNFEVPLKPSQVEPKEGYFYQNDDAPSFLENLGFDVFSFSNNHAFDYGMDGWQKTIDSFTNKPFGSGKYDDAYKLKIVEKDGIKIGFLALCYAARFGVFDNLSDKSSYGCAWINDLKVNHIILEAKKELDYLIVLAHDGIEYIDVPLPETIEKYRDFVDYGADAVIGTHPHCPQGWETYKGKPIFYSLGNFYFNSKTDYSYRATNRPHWYEGLCVILTLSNGQITHEIVNTRNTDNLALSVDRAEQRILDNKTVCNYLVDKKAYEDYLSEVVRKLAVEQELPIMDTVIHKATFKAVVKSVLLATKRAILGKGISSSDLGVQRLMKNDTRRNALLRALINNSL